MIRAIHRNPGPMDRHDRLEEVRSDEALARAASKRAGIPHMPLAGLAASAAGSSGAGTAPETGLEEHFAAAPKQPGTIEFADIVSPLPARDFFRLQYDCPQPVLLRGADDRFSHIVRRTDIDRLLFSGQCAARQIGVVLNGEHLAPGLFCKAPRPGQHPLDPREVDDRKLLSLLRRGAALMVDNAQRSLRGALELTHALSRATFNQAAATLHASWSSVQSLGAHWNDQDTFVLQVEGEKLWRIYGPTRVSPLNRDLVANHDPPKEPLWTGRLTAGDVLYLPRGWWHEVHSASDRERASIHIACTVRPRTGADFLAWLEEGLTARELFRRELPVLAHDSHWVAHVAAFHDLLEREIEDSSAEDWARAFSDECRSRWTDAGSARLAASLAPWQRADWDRHQVRLRGFEQCSLRCGPGENGKHERVLRLTANGATVELDRTCLPLVQPLVERRAVTVAQLKAVQPDQFDDAFVDEFIEELVKRALVSATAPD